MISLGGRMKGNYESRYRFYLTRRTPVIIRLDGKAFHTLTAHCDKPFDKSFTNIMDKTALYLCENIQGAKLAYVQSDEISILLTDYDKLNTDAWFDYNLQKIVSVSAGMASVFFSNLWGGPAVFDSRAFNIPKEEVRNYFVWRQKDWFKNSIQMLTRFWYSHKELHKKKIQDLHEMLFDKGVNWSKLEDRYKNGCCITNYKEWKKHYNFIFTDYFTIFETILEPEIEEIIKED